MYQYFYCLLMIVLELQGREERSNQYFSNNLNLLGAETQDLSDMVRN